jgi:multiple antibiotic resistance protein
MIVSMVSLNLADTFVTFLALMGPQKVLLSFARVARILDVRSLRLVAVATALSSAAIGVVLALTAPWLATFFHIGPAELAMASGLVFFIYAVGLVLGIHFDHTDVEVEPGDSGSRGGAASGAASGGASGGAFEGAFGGAAGGAGHGGPAVVTDDPGHPLRTGFRAMLLPFVVSPLAVAADLEESLSATHWSARWTVAGAFALVAAFDALCAIVLAPLLPRIHESLLEVLSRLLGILLAAVGVGLFLDGLWALGVLDH